MQNMGLSTQLEKKANAIEYEEKLNKM